MSRILLLTAFSFFSLFTVAQDSLQQPFLDCKVTGSSVIFDYRNNKWLITDTADSRAITCPASTFKVINLLIALETGVIKDEKAVVKWPGKTDTVLYGYRPEIYHDITVEEAFRVSAGWAFIELAKKVGRERYKKLLKAAGYGNGNLSEPGDDFWNFGPFGISPEDQVKFLVRLYEGKLPFSRKNMETVKRVMITETKPNYTVHSKTGWTRIDGQDIGWWVGYFESGKDVYFFATRIIKPRSEYNPEFSACRKNITWKLLKYINPDL